MAVANPPAYLDTSSYSAQFDRRWLGYDFLQDASGAGMSTARGGIVNSGDLTVTQNGTPNMTVNVAAGVAYIRGTAISNQGIYRCIASSTTNLTISGAHATLVRWDLVVGRVYDNTHDGSGQNAWALEVVTGTPSGSPSEPSLPTSAFKIARVTVNAAATSITTGNISNSASILNMRATSTAATLIKASNFDGQMAFGTKTINLTSGQSETVTTLSFGTTFKSVPYVIVAIDGDMVNPYVVHANRGSTTTTQTQIGIRKGTDTAFTGNATVDVSWIALAD
jgi:hypothetical protein